MTVKQTTSNRLNDFFDKLDSWSHKHPTTSRVAKVAAVMLGVGLVATAPWAFIALGVVFGTFAVIGGGALLIGSVVAVNRTSTAASRVSGAVSPMILSAAKNGVPPKPLGKPEGRVDPGSSSPVGGQSVSERKGLESVSTPNPSVQVPRNAPLNLSQSVGSSQPIGTNQTVGLKHDVPGGAPLDSHGSHPSLVGTPAPAPQKLQDQLQTAPNFQSPANMSSLVWSPQPNMVSSLYPANWPHGAFKSVDSTKLMSLDDRYQDGLQPNAIFDRNAFDAYYKACASRNRQPQLGWPSAPLIGTSDFVPPQYLHMQMYYKKRSALGVKYCQGDIITDGEAMLGGAFTAPVIQALIPGWWHWMGAQKPIPGAMFPRNEQGKIQVAQVVMSFTTHPDFELLGQGMWVLAGLSDQRLEGRSLSGDLKIPTVEEKKNPNIRTFYDNVLMSHAICHLIPGYTRPALSEINLQNVQQCIHQNLLVGYLDVLIQQNQISGQIGSLIPYAQFWYTNQQGQQFYQIVDLNLLHQSYIHQLRNELRVLNSAMPQGYVYTIDPPSIFAKTLGGAALGAGVLNRFQALAFQYLYKTEPQLFQNMKMFAFNDYVPNDNMLDHYQRNVFMQSQIKVVSKKTLFSTQNLHYNGPEGLALVIHPNGDLYGKNIQTEGYSSLEGLIGNTSNAACCLDPNFFSQADATQWATTGLMRHVARFSKAH